MRATRIGDAAALALGAAGVRLSRLNASCTPLTDAGLEAISDDLGDITAHLEVLDLCYCKNISAAAVMKLARHHPTLTMLGIGGFSEMNSPKLAEMLRACPHIVHLGIGGCDGLDGAALRVVAEHCAHLRQLNAHRMRDVRLGDAMALTIGCARLRGVDMSGVAQTAQPCFRDGDDELMLELRRLSDSDRAALNVRVVKSSVQPWSIRPWLCARPYAPDDEFDERHVDDGPLATWTIQTDGRHVDDAD